ncbi:MAG: DNA-directed RNA polymerase subunit omega [Rhodothermales bacterium]|nr:DNA-directed RNA polymerase subunit omega [Rhodothermales bacterium]MBO6778587.1 DNA-directed RNA polymerase subunit omega [Rhodothermales bacterium]
MSIKTVDIDQLAATTGNMYETVAILAKRARQVAMHTKAELDEKLAYFEGFDQELEDPRFQEEQARISLEYEVRTEPTNQAIDQFLNNELYYREATSIEDEF